MPTPFGVYQVIDGQIETIVISDGYCKLFGYADREEAIEKTAGDKMFALLHPDDRNRVIEAVTQFAEQEDVYDNIYRTQRGAGADYFVIHANGTIVHTEDGARLGYIWYTNEGFFSNDAKIRTSLFRKALNTALHKESLVWVSRYDTLTGIPNMSYFFELAEDWRKEREKVEDVFDARLYYFNLVGMKIYNTKYSFAEGDKLLKDFAKLIRKVFGIDFCCHIAADQFAAFTGDPDTEKILDRIIQETKKLNGGNSLPVHIGIYASTQGDVPITIACDRAKFACDMLKSSYESGAYHYESKMRAGAFWREYILSHLNQAIEEQWIQIYYQPLVRTVNGRVCDEEALSRWVDPKHGILSPAEFIPYLEESGSIYKLDLYVVEQVLEKMRLQEASGCYLVPHSVNLSRADFDSCDIVEEVRKRVDAAGISRKNLTIEITESTVGSDSGFMKKQVERFRALGFSVWMDDFGSGYSSLEVLQTIPFDLLKFDMSFMRRLNEGDGGKIILTELMRMATALGIDTACEGVETEDQVRFLREIGCSKLQGYYFSRPTSGTELIARYSDKLRIGFENPNESSYYETIGRVNLYDLSVIASKDDNAINRFFSTLPMGIVEIDERGVRFVRSNQSYREFLNRYFHFNLSEKEMSFIDTPEGPGEAFRELMKKCEKTSSPVTIDEELPDGNIVHSIARRICINKENGKMALVVAVLSISAA